MCARERMTSADTLARARVDRLAAFVTACLLAVIMAGCATPPHGEGPNVVLSMEQPTKEFRSHHAEVLEHLGHVDAMAARLTKENGDEQRQTMQRIVGFFKEHIGLHALNEERVLYPAVQRRAGEGSRLTEVPIHDAMGNRH